MSTANFAVSSEGRRPFDYDRAYDFSVTLREAVDIEVPIDELTPDFDARQNLVDVVSAIVSGQRISDPVLYSAAAAIQRQSKSKEAPQEWAERLAGTFFADL
jgi:hypothetical protein